MTMIRKKADCIHHVGMKVIMKIKPMQFDLLNEPAAVNIILGTIDLD